VSFFGLRFDFRNPDFAGTTMAERYEAALDMAEWADRLGFVIIVLSEHHGSDDGYLPSPLVMAAAIAAPSRRGSDRADHCSARPGVAEDVAVVTS
jgi:alkanesulfonate monooxygenase SsuD/methylene tetrahydromethanopterin reductase-like flavin-dependent oxidoreductase (luciferase family)